MSKNYQAGVKEYRETYWMPEYTPQDTDFLACFKVIPQEGVPREEAAAAVGKFVAERAVEAGVKEVAFDRSGFQYHGRVKELADAAREVGLKF